MVGAGILLTRLLGFVRERVFAHYLGNGPAADAFRAALKIPNVLRNLLGEGTLSASFIPVYARLLEQGDARSARALAGAILGLLMAASAAAALVGIWLAPLLTDIVAFGFDGPTREMTISLVRILFPMTGLMVVSGWCLGVLNSHRRFFLPYAAPAIWNVAAIAALWVAARWDRDPAHLATALAWGTLLGSVLQVLLQLPACARLLQGLPLSLSTRVQGVRDVWRAWVPVVIGAGVAQLASVIDTQLGSLRPGAVAALGYAQLLQTLPISLFGVAVAASALPELAREAEREEGMVLLRRRLGVGLGRIAFFVLPAAVGYVLLGRPLVAMLYQTGRFGVEETVLVTGILAAYGVGLLASASVKLLASGFYALRDTRTPVKVAIGSLAIGTVSGFLLLTRTPLGPAGIALGSAVGAWAYFMVMLRLLRGRLGATIVAERERQVLGRIGVALVPAALVGLGCVRVLDGTAVLIQAVGTWSLFGLTYLAVAWLLGLDQARELARRLGVRGGRR